MGQQAYIIGKLQIFYNIHKIATWCIWNHMDMIWNWYGFYMILQYIKINQIILMVLYISWLPFGCLPFFWSNDALMLSVLFLCFAWILEAGSKITENLAGQIKTCSSNALASSWAHENPKHQLVRHGHPIEIHHGEYPDRCIFERVWHRLFMGSPGSLTHWSRMRQGGRLPRPNWLSWYLLNSLDASEQVCDFLSSP